MMRKPAERLEARQQRVERAAMALIAHADNTKPLDNWQREGWSADLLKKARAYARAVQRARRTK